MGPGGPEQAAMAKMEATKEPRGADTEGGRRMEGGEHPRLGSSSSEGGLAWAVELKSGREGLVRGLGKPVGIQKFEGRREACFVLSVW